MSEAVDELIQIRDSQLDQFFEENDGNLRPWGTKDWKERRSEVIGDECEWCGDTEGPFQIHHTSTSPNWAAEWIRATDVAFIKSDSFDAGLIEERQECPGCASSNYYERKTVSPPFRCQDCGEEFSSPIDTPPQRLVKNPNLSFKKYAEPEFYTAKLEWVRNNKDVVLEAFKQRFSELMDQYMAMEDTITVCQACHYQLEQTSNVRCDDCGETFHKPNKPVCWDCLVERKGLEKCDCGDGWYQPDKYSSCSDCR